MRRLADWYRREGRHGLPWRRTRDRWQVLVSEVMLQQTQVARVEAAWPGFVARYPTPEAMAGAEPGTVIRDWGRLGYPRRARRLWESSRLVADRGWPDDLTALPGVGRYTARAVRAQADGEDVAAVDANIRRVAERVAGRRLRPHEVEAWACGVTSLSGRDRLLALMDVGAACCRPRRPRCDACPLEESCATRGVLDGETRHRQGPFEGSFRQRRGRVLAALRAAPRPVAELDAPALASLVDDGLAVVEDDRARLP